MKNINDEKRNITLPIYADAAATTMPCQAALTEMMPYLLHWYGNPSAVHKMGRDARDAVEKARHTIADIIGALHDDEIIFTSGGTESDNLAILSAATWGERNGKKHIVTTNIEHHAVGNVLKMLRDTRGFEITEVPAHENGRVRLDEVRDAFRPDTCLCTVMYVNNELGTIQPVLELGEYCADAGILYHTDAVQAFGHIDIDVADLRVDYLSASAHKFHGLKGSGFLYVEEDAPFFPQILGGGQENGRRSGTENVIGIVAMAAALKDATDNLDEREGKMCDLTDRLIEGLSEIPGAHYNGDEIMRVGGIVNFTFDNVSGESMLIMLEQAGIYASAGSACNSTDVKPSHVIKAIGYDDQSAMGTVRFSFDHTLDEKDIDYIVERTKGIVAQLRTFNPTR